MNSRPPALRTMEKIKSNKIFVGVLFLLVIVGFVGVVSGDELTNEEKEKIIEAMNRLPEASDVYWDDLKDADKKVKQEIWNKLSEEAQLWIWDSLTDPINPYTKNLLSEISVTQTEELVTKVIKRDNEGLKDFKLSGLENAESVDFVDGEDDGVDHLVVTIGDKKYTIPLENLPKDLKEIKIRNKVWAHTGKNLNGIVYENDRGNHLTLSKPGAYVQGQEGVKGWVIKGFHEDGSDGILSLGKSGVKHSAILNEDGTIHMWGKEVLYKNKGILLSPDKNSLKDPKYGNQYASFKIEEEGIVRKIGVGKLGMTKGPINVLVPGKEDGIVDFTGTKKDDDYADVSVISFDPLIDNVIPIVPIEDGKRKVDKTMYFQFSDGQWYRASTWGLDLKKIGEVDKEKDGLNYEEGLRKIADSLSIQLPKLSEGAVYPFPGLGVYIPREDFGNSDKIYSELRGSERVRGKYGVVVFEESGDSDFEVDERNLHIYTGEIGNYYTLSRGGQQKVGHVSESRQIPRIGDGKSRPENQRTISKDGDLVVGDILEGRGGAQPGEGLIPKTTVSGSEKYLLKYKDSFKGLGFSDGEISGAKMRGAEEGRWEQWIIGGKTVQVNWDGTIYKWKSETYETGRYIGPRGRVRRWRGFRGTPETYTKSGWEKIASAVVVKGSESGGESRVKSVEGTIGITTGEASPGTVGVGGKVITSPPATPKNPSPPRVESVAPKSSKTIQFGNKKVEFITTYKNNQDENVYLLKNGKYIVFRGGSCNNNVCYPGTPVDVSDCKHCITRKGQRNY